MTIKMGGLPLCQRRREVKAVSERRIRSLTRETLLVGPAVAAQ